MDYHDENFIYSMKYSFSNHHIAFEMEKLSLIYSGH